ncbi:MAG TPA: cupin domain-containing protein [Myxococcaceae bacterium]|nr:cupin domain-containing protein [Myxococcaceae bacterium]
MRRARRDSRLLPQGQTTVERSHVNELIAWVLKGEIDFRLGSEQRVRSQGDVVVIPGDTEHEAPFREDTEVIDFFAPPRDDFLLGGKPAYMSEG